MSNQTLLGLVVAVTVSLLFLTPAVTADEEMTVDEAVALLKVLDSRKLAEERNPSDIAKWEEAGAALLKAGDKAVAAIKKELQSLKGDQSAKDLFRINSSIILWQIGELDEADTVARIWNETPLDLNFQSVFICALQAAKTQDPRALPMLAATLKDTESEAYNYNHFLTIYWPQTHEFIWSAYGPDGLPFLLKTLTTADDPAVKQSALMVFGIAQYLPALETVRELALNADGDVRAVALEVLGTYGHPSDFEVIAGALKDNEERVIECAVVGLLCYKDLRAAPLLGPLLESSSPEVRRMTAMGLYSLPCPVGFDALDSHASAAEDEEHRELCLQAANALLGEVGVTRDAYTMKTAVEKEELFSDLIASREAQFALVPGDRRMTHDDLLKATAAWKKAGRLTGGPYVWVEDRHVLSAATHKDIDLLLDVKSQIVLRVSDECLPEMAVINELVRRLGWSRYRESANVVEKAMPVASQ